MARDGYESAMQRIDHARRERAVELDLSGTGLTTLPPEIGALTALKTLRLSINNLTTLPPEIGALTALKTLNLSSNQLTTLPPEIGALTALKTLSLTDNQLTTLPPEIANLRALQKLQLGDNNFEEFPDVIVNLTCLEELNLWGTILDAGSGISSLPETIRQLQRLSYLNLQSNSLTSLPEGLRSIHTLKELYLHDNLGLGLPDEILGPTVIEAAGFGGVEAEPPSEILDYYFSIKRSGGRALRELKLILIGRGDVGKSTLADALQGKPFRKNRPPTDGIKITRWAVKSKGEEAVVRIWDFGGQEIMHGTHQFFLTKRAIYVVMVDGRDDRYQREAEYWLKLVRAFGGASPVMVVMNRQKNYKFDLDRNALATKYGVSPDLFFPTECSQKKTITPVRRAIERLVGDILSAQANFPLKWWDVKAHLEQMKNDCLSDQEYRALCIEKGITDDGEQDSLLDRLNDLGTIVHFADESLDELKVLNPEWATDGVYRVVTNEKLREEKKGKLRGRVLKDILPRNRWPKPMHRRYVLDLMQKFDLCFPAEDSDDLYIVPELLPERTPDLSDWDAKAGVVFRYKYPVLPHGILPRFISKTHTLSERQPRWRSGVIVAKDGAEALVRADYDESTVDIWVRGPYRDARRAMLTIIRNKFDEIHYRIKDLSPAGMVGMPPDPTVFVPYLDLVLDWRGGETTVRVTIAGSRREILLEDILSGVESREERVIAADRAAATPGYGKPGIVVHGDYYEQGGKHMPIDRSIHIGGDVTNSQVAQTMENCTNLVQEQAPGPKRELMEKLRHDVEDLITRLPEDKKAEAPQVVEHLELAIKQASKDTPDRKWYSVSAEGLMQAAAWVQDFSGKIGGTLKNLGAMLWPDFSLPKLGK